MRASEQRDQLIRALQDGPTTLKSSRSRVCVRITCERDFIWLVSRHRVVLEQRICINLRQPFPSLTQLERDTTTMNNRERVRLALS